MAKIDIKKSLADTMFNRKAIAPESEPAAEQPKEGEKATGQPIKPVKASTRKPKVKAAPKVKKPANKSASDVRGKKVVKSAPAKKVEAVQEVSKDKKMPFTFQIPESLHARLSYYVENHAVGRGSSIAKIIVAATDAHLTELEKKAGITPK
jgi:hypothetical protein